ncbi:FAD:protein FMN transferase [Limnoglobus roseus]|uniref:FAD:protein FMN transferase n=1 Tax=Limnoglobus roseus TaxID=2598579 RepID=A0A5C1AEB1_9BACT|nr:FAD:protein FMN transferase [Limnoglobus roseus]QEL17050.1 FAD:protein FMN transferase [Limnoglobus roseus]
MQRRDFLSVSPASTIAPLLPPDPDRPADYNLLRVSRRAMATTFEVAIPYGQPNALEAATEALDLIDDLEDQLTVYRDHSEVSRLNATAADGAVVVEPQLFDLLSLSASLTNDTAETFDIATGSLIKAWGFYRREGRVPTAAERLDAMAATGTRHLILDATTHSVKFRRRGLEINLGAIGKGYALDRAAKLLKSRWGIDAALLHGGGSSVCAIGCPPDDGRGWPVAVRHPWDDDRTLGTVRLRDCGFATSAATFQHFIYNGQKLGHLLDPRTGWPATGTASASVIAPSAAEADAISTAFFVMGHAAAEEFVRTRPHLGGIVLPNGEDGPRVFGEAVRCYSPPTFRETYLNTLTYPD